VAGGARVVAGLLLYEAQVVDLAEQVAEVTEQRQGLV